MFCFSSTTVNNYLGDVKVTWCKKYINVVCIFIEIFEFLSKKSYYRSKVLMWSCKSLRRLIIDVNNHESQKNINRDEGQL